MSGLEGQRRQLRIVGSGMPGQTRVELDGMDVTRCLKALAFQIGVDQEPTAVLDIVLWDVSTDADNPRIVVSEDCHKVLTYLGWTPPEGDGAS